MIANSRGLLLEGNDNQGEYQHPQCHWVMTLAKNDVEYDCRGANGQQKQAEPAPNALSPYFDHQGTNVDKGCLNYIHSVVTEKGKDSLKALAGLSDDDSLQSVT